MAHFRRRSQQVAWHSVASANGKKDSLSNNVPALLQLSLLTKKPKEQPHAHMQIPHTWLTFLSLNTVETCDASSSPAVPVWHTHPLALAQLAQVAQLGMLGAALGR